MQHLPLTEAFDCPILLMMGRKNSANEGPVHSPIGRRHAKKEKRRPNKKHNNKPKTKQAKEQQTKTKIRESLQWQKKNPPAAVQTSTKITGVEVFWNLLLIWRTHIGQYVDRPTDPASCRGSQHAQKAPPSISRVR
jgi:hypothetical protein